MAENLSRRTILLRALQVPACGALLWGLAGCGAGAGGSASGNAGGGSQTVCADPQKLSDDEQSMRAAAHYNETSPDPQKVCAGCAFFGAAQSPGACGQCEMFHGPVNSHGHCDSWSAKS